MAITGNPEGADAVGATEDDRLLIATIRPEDGSFDWSRTWFGVMEGLHGLHRTGDRCIGRRDPYRSIEVATSAYTPTRSRIEITRSWADDYLWASATLDIRLQADGNARFDLRTVDSDGETETVMSAVLRRDPSRQRKGGVSRWSRLAGNWAADPKSEAVILIIRQDGTFDWTGTIEGSWGMWYQLEEKGDRSFNAMDPRAKFEFVSSRYTPTESRLILRNWTNDPSGDAVSVTTEVLAKRKSDRAMTVTLRMRASDGSHCRYDAILYRNKVAQRRVESALSRLGDL